MKVDLGDRFIICNLGKECKVWYKSEEAARNADRTGFYDGVIDVGAGIGDAGSAFFHLPEDIVKFVTGTDRHFAERRDWSRFGEALTLEDNPVVRVLDTTNRLVYGGADAALGHVPYAVLNDGLGLDIPYLTPAPSNLRDATNEVATAVAGIVVAGGLHVKSARVQIMDSTVTATTTQPANGLNCAQVDVTTATGPKGNNAARLQVGGPRPNTSKKAEQFRLSPRDHDTLQQRFGRAVADEVWHRRKLLVENYDTLSSFIEPSGNVWSHGTRRESARMILDDGLKASSIDSTAVKLSRVVEGMTEAKKLEGQQHNIVVITQTHYMGDAAVLLEFPLLNWDQIIGLRVRLGIDSPFGVESLFLETPEVRSPYQPLGVLPTKFIRGYVDWTTGIFHENPAFDPAVRQLAGSRL